MNIEFFINQSVENQKKYIDLLEITGSLSSLFSESNSPFLYYRSMENIFCKAFFAENLSRSDISVDAKKNQLGIGLKTFLKNNGKTFQKIAEFNRESYLIRDLRDIELIKKISNMRNERIKSTMRICDLKDVIYHIVTRSKNKMTIYEEHMDFIDVKNIELLLEKGNTIYFSDKINEYCFNISKSTLFKRFNTLEYNKIFEFNVELIDDPYEYLLNLKTINFKINNYEKNVKIQDYIVLPLYSPRTGKVEKQSGLNLWNASGRIRNENEVYISIPSWIHKVMKDFFIYNTDDYKTNPFDVKLPNGKKISMKVAQQGGKALMSNPNSALGEWILRDVLQIEAGVLVTKMDLDIIGIDSIKLTKLNDMMYTLDFLKTGSYEEFERKYRNK